MAGKPKTGLDYAGWSVNLFDGDTKIDKLLDAQGLDRVRHLFLPVPDGLQI